MTTLLPFFKALSDETRLRLVNILIKHKLNVNELVQILEMGQSRISRHLKILADSGLLIWHREGLWVFYTAASKGKCKEFLNVIQPFFQEHEVFLSDNAKAQSMIEERTHKTNLFFNTIAEDWDTLSQNILGDFSLADTVLDTMPNCNTAVDLGCGTGNVLATMLLKAENVIGVDGSQRMLELASHRFHKKNDRISLRIGDLSHLPLRDNEANFASLNLVLHHMISPADILQEIWRVLSAQGFLLITDFIKHDDERMREEYGDRWLGFDHDILELYLQRAGFSLLSVKTVPVERGLTLQILLAQKNEENFL